MWLCLSWLGEGSGLLGLRLGVSHVMFLGELVWECRSRATVVPQTSGKDPVESLERTRKDSGSGWNALIAIGRRWRIPVCLAYGRRTKWISVKSTTQPSPTDIVQPREGHCSSSNSNREGEVSARPMNRITTGTL